MSEVAPAAAPAAAEPAAIAPAQTAEVKSEPLNQNNIESALTAAYEKKFEQPRENGKFAGKTPPEGGTEIPDQPQTVAQEQAKPAIDAPQSWSADMKAHWATLPPAAQEYIAKRESEAHKRISQFGEQFRTVEPLAKVAKQHERYFASKGGNAIQFLENMVAMSQSFDQNPLPVLEHLARQRGIDLASHYGLQQAGNQSDLVRSLRAEIAAARQEARQAGNIINQRQQAEMQQAHQAVLSKIEAFSKDKPDFKELQADIVKQTLAIRQAEPEADADDVLARAYEAARWANPAARAKLLEEQRKEEASKREAEQKKKAEEARKLGTLNVKSTGNTTARKGSWEDTLRAVGDRIA